MGEVYRARDTKLGRDVAVKLLPESVSRDPGRLARLESEARALATLNHPNIATLYGLEETAGTRLLVMELVEGETLAERISRGPLSIQDALPVFLQIAEALEEAHHKRIIHRDLKPGNVKLTPELRVKVLDFGLAKAMDGSETHGRDLSQSPTVTRPTIEGTILGTASYMSPEQARGKPVDARTDIWAFACCLFEALTGRKAFDGDSATDILAAIVDREPDWKALPAGTHSPIERLLRRGLEKDARRRLQDIGDARLEILEAMAEPVAQAGTSRVSRGLPMKAAVPLLAALAGFAVWGVLGDRREIPPSITRFTIAKPPSSGMSIYRSLAFSPDGRVLAYTSPLGLFLRRFDGFDSVAFPGTEGATQPFFSPDGAWVGFLAPGSLKKVPVSGGAALTICVVEAGLGLGAAWGRDGTIVFSDGFRLHRVSAEGGASEVLLGEVREGQSSLSSQRVSPALLPDGDRVLFTITSSTGPHVNVFSLRTRETHELALGRGYAASAHYLPSGHLLYSEPGGLMAVRVDPDTLSPRGPVVPAVEGAFSTWTGSTDFAVSESGNLAYISQHGGSQLVKVDRGGRASPIVELRREYYVPRVSPDGSRLAVGIFDPTVPRRDIWTYDLVRGSMSRLTVSDGDSTEPAWSFEGGRIAFASNRERGVWSIFVKASDATGGEIELAKSPGAMMPEVWLPGAGALLVKWYSETSWDIGLYRFENERGPEILLGSAFNEIEPSLSPNGHFLSYVSDETGRREVYVQRFPSLEGRWQVSTGGGDEPMFSPDGREIFYRSGDRMMVASFASEPQVSFSRPRVLFEGRYDVDPFANDARNYDIMPDGEHFVMIRRDDEASEIRVVLNWIEELKRLAPVER
jgi:serine/threonine-protein kinase